MALFNYPRRPEVALTVLRLALGIVFIVHGAQKMFVWGHSGTATAFGHMGVTLPGLAALYSMIVEFFGGVLLVLGLLTPLVAALLALDMLGAIIFVHSKGGFFVPNGIEFTGMLLVGAIAILLGGPGRLALDRARTARAEPLVAR